MTEENLDLLLDLAMEQYDPKPGKIEWTQQKIIGKAWRSKQQKKQIDHLFQTSFSVFSSLMQTI